MRIKTILSTAAFVVAFVFSSAFASLFVSETEPKTEFFLVNAYKSVSGFKSRSESATAVRISFLISEDSRNGRESDRRAYEMKKVDISPFVNSSFPAYADSVERYADASSSLETDALPRDFQKAWREHMNAWRDYSAYLNRMENSSNRMGWSQAEFEDAEKFYTGKIYSTWRKVGRIGESYGADISY